MSFANFDIEAQKGRNPVNVTFQPLNELSNKLSDFTSNVSKIDRYQQQLGTKRDNSQLRSQVDKLVTQTDKLQQGITQQLSKLELANEESSSNNQNATFSFTLDKLQTQFQQVFKNYQVVVRSYNEKLQSVRVNEEFAKNEREQQLKLNANTALLSQGTSSTTSNATNYGSTGNDLDEDMQAQTQIQRQALIQKQQGISETELQYHQDLIQHRENAIENISKGVQDINKIFSDLNEIVNQQGEQIDTIEDNLVSYSTDNQLASRELTKADEYQKKKGKWSCVILVALVVISLIILAVIS
ncbi:unnamed protein product [Ambrosiozyma monospora]|uniref:Unnamed protein product n=1 Tax=Ambrosiozyma monospora TaxID=43982 RepID=A0A9W6YVI9_AMBMO|nr:unnamed protein product [Ambrosiozyma monospora]